MTQGYGVRHPYREHSKACGEIIVTAKDFVTHCENVSRAETGTASEFPDFLCRKARVALNAMEAAFYRGDSPYKIGTLGEAVRSIEEQGQRLQDHMPGRYVREDDPVPERYQEGGKAMKAMASLHELAESLAEWSSDSDRKPPMHLLAVQAEMCWHVLEICEQGANAIAETWKDAAMARAIEEGLDSEPASMEDVHDILSRR